MESKYTPWSEQGISEVAYWKMRYLTASKASYDAIEAMLITRGELELANGTKDGLVSALKVCLERIESDIETPNLMTAEGCAARAALASVQEKA